MKAYTYYQIKKREFSRENRRFYSISQDNYENNICLV